MKLSTFKRLVKEDVKPEYRELVDKLAFSINPFAEEVTKALNNNLSIADNFNQNQKTIVVQVDSSGTPTQPTSFKTNLSSNCTGIQVILATNQTNPSIYPTGHPFISFTQANGIVTINNITGLPANNKFQLSLILHQ